MTLVSGVLIDSRGIPVPAAVLKIAPTLHAARSRLEGVEVPSAVTATADAAGFVSFTALPGQYVGSVSQGSRLWSVELVVPVTSPAALLDCIEAGGGELTPASVAAAQLARDQAVAAAASGGGGGGGAGGSILTLTPQGADPVSPADGQAWYREDLGQIRYRLGGKTGTLVIQRAETALAVNTTVTAADWGKTLRCTASLTLTLPVAPEDGFQIAVSASTSTSVTLVTGAATIDRDSMLWPAAGARTPITAGDTVLSALQKVQKYHADLSALAFSGSYADLSGRPVTLAGYGITDAQPLDAGLTALGGLSTVGLYYLSAADTWSPVTIGANLTFSGGTLAASGGGGGSSAWGGITGTLSDQADLQSALTAKVSTTGAETIAGKKTFSSEWGSTALGADPASPVNGDEWLSPDGALKGRQEGATFRLSSPWVATLIRPASGEWLTNTQHGSGGAHGQSSGILNALDLAPWRPSFDFVSSNVVFTINGAGGAGVLCKSLIYEGDPLTGKPLTKIFEGADKDANTIGTKSDAFSYSFRSDRTYWIGVRHSASTTVVANWSASAGADIFVAGYTSGARKSLRRTLTYATAAPSTWTWSASELTTISPWAFWIQAA